MFFAVVLLAAIPAYLAGLVALLMGQGWFMALGAVSVTGTVLVILTMVALTFRDRLVASSKKRFIPPETPGGVAEDSATDRIRGQWFTSGTA